MSAALSLQVAPPNMPSPTGLLWWDGGTARSDRWERTRLRAVESPPRRHPVLQGYHAAQEWASAPACSEQTLIRILFQHTCKHPRHRFSAMLDRFNAQSIGSNRRIGTAFRSKRTPKARPVQEAATP